MKSQFSHFIYLDPTMDPDKFKGSKRNPPYWRWLINLGIGFLIAGLIAIALPQFVTTAINVLLGSVLLIIGSLTAFYAYRVRFFSYDSWPLFTSLILLFCGVLLIIFPKFGAISITLIIAIFFIFSGMGKVALAQLVRLHNSGKWVMLSGLIDLTLSFLIFFNLNTISDWLLGLLLGVSLIMQGWWNIRLALTLRNTAEHVISV